MEAVKQKPLSQSPRIPELDADRILSVHHGSVDHVLHVDHVEHDPQ